MEKVRRLLDKANKKGYAYSLITNHDSWISLDPIIGCRNDCQYCVLTIPGWTKTAPQKVYSLEETISALFNHKYFIPNKTAVCIGNRTDSFLKDNIDFIFNLLSKINEKSLKNPICIATKQHIPVDIIRAIKDLKNMNLIIFLSLSGLPRNIEPTINVDAIKENFQNLSTHRIPVVHYWRPLLPVNTMKSSVFKMLEFVTRYAKASVAIELKQSSALLQTYRKILKKMDNANLVEPFGDCSKAINEIFKISRSSFCGYPVFKHTSCAVSFVLKKPEYNATIYKKEICQESICSDSQFMICKSSVQIPSKGRIEVLMNHLDLDLPFKIKDNEITLEGSISQEDYIFLLHNINFPIRAKVNYSNVWLGSIYNNSFEPS